MYRMVTMVIFGCSEVVSMVILGVCEGVLHARVLCVYSHHSTNSGSSSSCSSSHRMAHHEKY